MVLLKIATVNHLPLSYPIPASSLVTPTARSPPSLHLQLHLRSLLSCLSTAALFPPAPHWPTAPEAVIVNPGPDRSGTENSIFMIRMSDLVKILHWILFLMQCPCYFCPCKNGASDGIKAEDQCLLQTYFGH